MIDTNEISYGEPILSEKIYYTPPSTPNNRSSKTNTLLINKSPEPPTPDRRYNIPSKMTIDLDIIENENEDKNENENNLNDDIERSILYKENLQSHPGYPFAALDVSNKEILDALKPLMLSLEKTELYNKRRREVYKKKRELLKEEKEKGKAISKTKNKIRKKRGRPTAEESRLRRQREEEEKEKKRKKMGGTRKNKKSNRKQKRTRRKKIIK